MGTINQRSLGPEKMDRIDAMSAGCSKAVTEPTRQDGTSARMPYPSSNRSTSARRFRLGLFHQMTVGRDGFFIECGIRDEWFVRWRTLDE